MWFVIFRYLTVFFCCTYKHHSDTADTMLNNCSNNLMVVIYMIWR